MAKCGGISLHIQTNADLVNALNQTLNQLDFCIAENTALKQCIADFNQTSTEQVNAPKEKE